MQLTGATVIIVLVFLVLVAVAIGVAAIQRSRSSGHAFGNEPKDREGNPYLDSGLIEYSLLDSEKRSSQSWRRAFFGCASAVVLCLAVIFVLATKDHTEAIVYKEDQTGDLALIGKAGSLTRPSDLSVKNGFANWIKDARTIPGDDPELVQQNFQSLMAMVVKDSNAFTAIQERVKTENPIALAKKGYRRTVTRVEVNQLSDLTYRVAWSEAVRQGSNVTVSREYAGTLTIAQRPAVPTDPMIGQLNPSGIYVTTYDIPWSTLE